MNILYYIQTNLACIIILLLFLRQTKHRSERFSTNRIIFNQLIMATIVICISDAVAGSLGGLSFPGAHALIEINNMIYFESLVVISCLWMMYAEVKLNDSQKATKKKMTLATIPLLAFTVILLTNPFTELLFSINEKNEYIRNNGVWIHWIVSWGYLLFPTFKTIHKLLHEKNKIRRQEYVPLLYFVIAPLIASAIQIICYGFTTIQVGITISVVMIFLSVQNGQVLTDALTELNNRRGLNRFLESQLQHKPDTALTFLMIDINHFKTINDKFGHLIGDHALQSVSDVLKQLCQKMPEKLFVCRYGGDEFVIVGVNLDENAVDKIKKMIREGLQAQIKSNNEPYSLAVSIGAAKGFCADINDVEHLLRVADEAMYEDKKSSVLSV